MRRGLPRVPGGEPWPPASVVTTAASAAPAVAAVSAGATAASATAAAHTAAARTATAAATQTPPAAADSAQNAGPDAAKPQSEANEHPSGVRRGLPRTPGGEPWPPADYVPSTAASATPAAPAPATAAAEVPEAPVAAVDAPVQEIVVEASSPSGDTTTEVAVAASVVDVSTPLPFTRTVWQGSAARAFERDRIAGTRIVAPEPTRIGPFTRLQWVGAAIVAGGGLLVVAALGVVAVRWLLSLQQGQDFLTTYPGEYHLPEGAPVGFPAWLGWQHFFNVFLVVLIIRSGLQVRNEKRPTAFWTPRNKPKGKISLTLWFHQALDVLWIVNGVIFVVLLFVSGQWMRIIPTSWEVFPNALSAVLQYISLDWPTENGWVNYNSVQQLAYFTTVFIAAPLAIITGVRMSGIWPKKAKTLNRLYPVEWARKVHFPTMIYFVLFIFVHVVLVFATGALRNLNHMYAAQGSVDPNAYADNWAGFWIFAGSMIVIAAGWVAARPLVLAPIAKLFGNVSGR